MANNYYGQVGLVSFADDYSPKEISLDLGKTFQIPKTGMYKSSDESVATVNTAGLITVVGYGTANIAVNDATEYTIENKLPIDTNCIYLGIIPTIDSFNNLTLTDVVELIKEGYLTPTVPTKTTINVGGDTLLCLIPNLEYECSKIDDSGEEKLFTGSVKANGEITLGPFHVYGAVSEGSEYINIDKKLKEIKIASSSDGSFVDKDYVTRDELAEVEEKLSELGSEVDMLNDATWTRYDGDDFWNLKKSAIGSDGLLISNNSFSTSMYIGLSNIIGIRGQIYAWNNSQSAYAYYDENYNLVGKVVMGKIVGDFFIHKEDIPQSAVYIRFSTDNSEQAFVEVLNPTNIEQDTSVEAIRFKDKNGRILDPQNINSEDKKHIDTKRKLSFSYMGDSLTQMGYCGPMQRYLDRRIYNGIWKVNAVGSLRAWDLASAMGEIPLMVMTNVCLTKDKQKYEIQLKSGLDTNLSAALTNYSTLSVSAKILNRDVVLEKDGNKYYISLNDDIDRDLYVLPNTEIIQTNSNTIADVLVYWCGTNSEIGASLTENIKHNLECASILQEVYRWMFVIGLYVNKSSDSDSLDNVLTYNAALRNKFGSRFIDIRAYLFSRECLADMKTDYENMSDEDKQRFDKGYGPLPSFYSNDGLHPNAILCDCIAKYVAGHINNYLLPKTINNEYNY